jgi:hypothetical protein
MSKTVHLIAPETPENHGANVFCPIEVDFTQLVLGHSADGMETFACGACNEPEPVISEVTDVTLDVIAQQLNNNK